MIEVCYSARACERLGASAKHEEEVMVRKKGKLRVGVIGPGGAGSGRTADRKRLAGRG